jgi:hypothetical protein
MINDLALPLEMLAAIVTLVYVGRLVLVSTLGEACGRGGSFPGWDNHKKSLRGQVVVSR